MNYMNNIFSKNKKLILSFLKLIPVADNIPKLLDIIHDSDEIKFTMMAETFIKTIQLNNLKEDFVVNYIEKEYDENTRAILLPYIVSLLRNDINTIQAAMHAEMLCDLIHYDLSWKEFELYTQSISSMIIQDFISINKLFNSNCCVKRKDRNILSSIEYRRLLNFGFIDNICIVDSVEYESSNSSEDILYQLNEAGKKIGNYSNRENVAKLYKTD